MSIPVNVFEHGGHGMDTAFTKPSINRHTAMAMVDRAVTKATELGVPQVVAVLDESGLLKAFCRMDGAALVAIETAQHKAFTALYGLPSGALFDAIKTDPALLTSMPQVPRFTLIGGGFPVAVGNTVVGAIGVSGGTVDQDVACAHAALRALEPTAG
jgi:uncharacterized protein GlcG (DUF336 family)